MFAVFNVRVDIILLKESHEFVPFSSSIGLYYALICVLDFDSGSEFKNKIPNLD